MTSYPQSFPVPPEGGGSGAVDDPLVPRSVGDWVSKVVGVVARSWQPLVVIQIAAALPGLLIAGVVQWSTAGPAQSSAAVVSVSAVGGLIALAAALFAQGASVYVVVRDAVARPVRAGEALSFAAGRALPLLGWSIVAGLLVLGGLVLLIVPGLYVIIVFAASFTGVVVIERRGIGRTFELVNRRFGPTLGRVLIALLAAIVYTLLADLVAVALTAPETLTRALLQGLLQLPISLASVGVAVVTYAELRHHENPAVGAPALAAELEA